MLLSVVHGVAVCVGDSRGARVHRVAFVAAALRAAAHARAVAIVAVRERFVHFENKTIMWL